MLLLQRRHVICAGCRRRPCSHLQQSRGAAGDQPGPKRRPEGNEDADRQDVSHARWRHARLHLLPVRR